MVEERGTEGFDGIDGSNDGRDDTNDNDHGAPGELIELHLSPSDQLEVKENGQDKDQRAVAESAEEGQEIAKEGDSAGNTTADTDDNKADDRTVDTLHDFTAAGNSDIDETLKLESKGGQENGGGEDDVDDNENGSGLGEGIIGEVGEDGRNSLGTVGEVAGDGGGDVKDGAGGKGSSNDAVPGLGVSHGLLDVHVDNVTAEADRDRGNGGGEVGEDDVIVGDLGVSGVVVLHVNDRTADGDNDEDNGGEGTKDRHDSDLLESLHGNKGDSDNGGADPDPGLLADGIGMDKRVHLGTGQDHVHDGGSEDDRGVEEPDGNETGETVGVTADLLVGGKTVLAIVVEAPHQEDGGVDRHQEREQQDADSDPATHLQGIGETKSTSTCKIRERERNGGGGINNNISPNKRPNIPVCDLLL